MESKYTKEDLQLTNVTSYEPNHRKIMAGHKVLKALAAASTEFFTLNPDLDDSRNWAAAVHRLQDLVYSREWRAEFGEYIAYDEST